VNWGKEIGTGSSVTLTASNRIPGEFWLKLFVSGADGVWISTDKFIDNPCEGFLQESILGNTKTFRHAGFEGFGLYLKPDGGLVVSRTGNERYDVAAIVVRDALGLTVAEYTLPAHSRELVLDTAYLPGGLYTVTIGLTSRLFSQKLIIQN
jgi:hypothetical protein